MKRQFKKNLITGLSLAVVAGALTSTLGLANTNSAPSSSSSNLSPTINAAQFNSRTPRTALEGDYQTNNNNVTNTPNFVVNANTISGNYTLDTPSQNIARDNTDSSFAAFTSSTENGPVDQITRYVTTAQNRNPGSTTGNSTIFPGEVSWIVRKSDLANILGINNADLSLTGMVFSSGGFGSYPALFVLTHSTSTNANSAGSYLFRIQWQAVQTAIPVGSTIPRPGDYRLAQKITNTAAERFDQLSLESPATSSIQVLQTRPITNAAAAQTLTYVTVSDATFLTPTNTSNLIRFTYSVPAALSSTVFTNGMQVKASFRFNSDMFFLFQLNTATAANADRMLTLVRLPLQSQATSAPPPVTLTNENFLGFNLSTFFNNGTLVNSTARPLAINLLNIDGGNNLLTIANSGVTPSATGQSSFVQIRFNVQTAFDPATTERFTASTHTVLGTGVYFRSIAPLFGGSNNASVIGYVAIDNLNRSLEFRTNLDFRRVLFNFNQASVRLGDIFYVHTISGSSNWYALMTDTRFAQFSETVLIGRWDILSSRATQELPVNYIIRTEQEINPTILFQQVANANNTNYSTEFTNFLAQTFAYEQFMNLTFVDPRLGAARPSIQIEFPRFADINSSDRIYNIPLTFRQSLRSLNPDGSINNAVEPTSTVLFTQTFTFVNAAGTLTPANDISAPFTPPAFVTGKLPSQVTNEEIREQLFRVANVGNVTFTPIANDIQGTLTVTASIGAIWSQISGTFVLETNVLRVFTLGSDGDPFFNTDPLFGRDATVQVIDQAFADNENNAQRIEALRQTFRATLPSNVNAQTAISNFLVTGSAFNDQNLIDSGLITLPTANDITIVPFDQQGRMLIRVVFPRIGNQVNQEFLFTTPQVFLVDPTADENAYFVFKTNQDALATEVAEDTALSTLLPSTIARNLSVRDDPAGVASTLSNFAIFSNYFNRLLNDAVSDPTLIRIDTVADDANGNLVIDINLRNPLPGTNITNFRKAFSGFRESGTSPALTPSTFSFGQLPANLLAQTPSRITEADLLNSGALVFGGSAANLRRTITLTPINSSGSLEVKITFFNWIQRNADGSTTVLATRDFSRVFTGLQIANPQVDSLVWNSFSSLNPSLQTVLPSAVAADTNTLRTNLEKISRFATLSSSVREFIRQNDNALDVSFVANDATGSLTVIAILTGFSSQSSTDAFQTTLAGFSFTGASSLNVTFAAQDSLQLQNLMQNTPSAITMEQVMSLVQIPEDQTLNSDVSVRQNDNEGTLTIDVTLRNAITGTVIRSSSQTYSGFLTFVAPPQEVDVVVIVASIVGTTILLGIPAILINVLRNRKIINQTAKKLDTRLREQEKKSKRQSKI